MSLKALALSVKESDNGEFVTMKHTQRGMKWTQSRQADVEKDL